MTEEACVDPHIVLIGAGPRAITLVDRLGAHAARGSVRIRVTLVDPYPAGAGRVWNTSQPRVLLNNTSASETTVFCDATITSAAPIDGGPSLYEWCGTMGSASVDPRVRAEAAGTQPWTKPARALQGAYYSWALDEVIRRHRDTLQVVTRRATVEHMNAGEPTGLTLSDGSILHSDAVIFSMGFVDDVDDEAVTALAAHAAAVGGVYRPPGPMELSVLEDVDFHTPVLVRGLGATFFDLLGLLEVDGPGGGPTGLVAGSGHGLPKRAQPDGPGPEVDPTRVTTAAVARLLDRHAGSGSADAAAVWRAVHADLRDEYERYSAPLAASVAGPFDWADVAAPRQRRGESFTDALDRFFAQEAITIESPQTSPWAAVRRAVLEIRPRILRLIRAGAFSSAGAELLRAHFLQPAGRLTSGPPAGRQALLARWRREGRVTLLGPAAEYSTAPDGFRATSPVNGAGVHARQLLEARQAFGSVTRSGSGLLRQLLRGGLIESAASPDEAGIKVNPVDHRVAVTESAAPPWWVAGHLARSAQWGVNQGAIPHSADPFLQESDTIAASVVAWLIRERPTP
ncbi:FAD/NAD(P)-binding protein [Microbacterium sp.]|uniref:FAD/NAD(P)-binding protein n=1 Tax=Microbacterium sp. TaxID=51671 RepID=UPI0039E2884E